MTIRQNGGAGGTDGVAVSVANSGGASGTAWDAIAFGTGTIDYDDDTTTLGGLHDAMCFRLAPSSNQVTELRWNLSAEDSAHSVTYWKIPSAYTVTSTIVQMRHAGGTMASLHITNNPRVVVRNAAGTGVFNSATANMSLDTWYRFELKVIKGTTTSNGTIDFAMYPGDSLIAQATYTSTTANTGTAQFTDLYLGRNSQFTTDTTVTHFDSITLYTGADVGSLGRPWEGISPPATITKLYIWDGAAWVESEDGIQVFDGASWEF